MATRKKKNAIQFLILLIIVVLIVAISWGVMRWYNNRPGPAPQDVHLSASINGQKTDVAPYSACEIGASCPDGSTTDVDLGTDDTLSIELPKDVYDHEWSLLKIYDDPAANDQSTFGSNQQKTVEVKGSSDPLTEGGNRPRLVVVEISSLLIGHDSDGNETPYTVTWSIHVKGTQVKDESLAPAASDAPEATDAPSSEATPTQ
ncbi:MAG: DUF2771 domain-containing protein [Corynebacterium sp.]|nr:DUF2771 domain-containing protein [Corynebacterium sp.]